MTDLDTVLLDVHDLCIDLVTKKESTSLVKNLSYQLKKGEVLGIVGESGSGKSISSLSLLQLLPEALQVTSGTAKFNGTNLLDASNEQIRKIRGKEISMIFQEPMSSMNPSMRCGPQVIEMILNHESISKASAKKRAVDLFNNVKLPEPERIYQAYPHQLSGGQIQRVMIAMAMACNPKVLIADECTTALDVTVQKEILKLLKQLNEEYGIAVVFISHDLGVISEIADRVLVMKEGQMVELGKTQSIFNNPNNAYTKQLLASRPPIDAELHKLPEPALFEDDSFTKDAFYRENIISKEEVLAKREKLNTAPIRFEVKDLVKFYPKSKNFWGKPTAFVKAVDHVSFQIKDGETVGLVGESGSGKSSVSKASLRIIEADGGTVLFENRNIYDLSSKELKSLRKDVQYIFQDPFSSLNPRMKVGEAIAEPMLVHNVYSTKEKCKARAMELLSIVGLTKEHYHRYPHEFSGGQRQRIGIARALSLEPKLLVCDEIVSALDVSVQAQILNLLKDLQKEFDLSILFVSHDLSVVKFISDRILVMKDGKIVEEGFPEEIFYHAKNPYTSSLIAAIPGR